MADSYSASRSQLCFIFPDSIPSGGGFPSASLLFSSHIRFIALYGHCLFVSHDRLNFVQPGDRTVFCIFLSTGQDTWHLAKYLLKRIAECIGQRLIFLHKRLMPDDLTVLRRPEHPPVSLSVAKPLPPVCPCLLEVPFLP